jgi:hypothetical protein
MIGQYLPNNNETARVAFRQKFCQLNSPFIQVPGHREQSRAKQSKRQAGGQIRLEGHKNTGTMQRLTEIPNLGQHGPPSPTLVLVFRPLPSIHL